MKINYLLLLLILVACNNAGDTRTVQLPDTPKRTGEPEPTVLPKKDTLPAGAKQYANARFKEVTVQESTEGVYLIQGKAQVFEASFSWVVEDGHHELKKGYQTTDAGAPEWGNFKFTVEVVKARPNSTLTLILFEASAKDGSRQHELPIVLN